MISVVKRHSEKNFKKEENILTSTPCKEFSFKSLPLMIVNIAIINEKREVSQRQNGGKILNKIENSAFIPREKHLVCEYLKKRKVRCSQKG